MPRRWARGPLVRSCTAKFVIRDHGGCRALCFTLIDITAARGKFFHSRCALLLHRMRDFMRHHGKVGGLFACAEKNVIADGHCARSLRACHRRRVRSGVHAHGAQISVQTV